MVQPVATTILVGVAAMRRKLNSAPMQAILASLRQANPHFHLVIFDDVQMACDPHTWPRVHVLLTLYSANFPLQNVLDYIALHNPLLVNNLHRQHCMQDRREVRRVLASAHVPTPDAVCVDRTAGDVITQTGQSDDTLVILRPDHSVATIRKPFVEKPVDPEDHNVYIYYKGGGVRKLFRKTKSESSHYAPAVTQVRQTGNYVYEQFYEPEQCADVKVYGVGNYFYAEARKAPHIDGIVDRDPRGRERRIPVVLSDEELHICRKATQAFDQFVLGFDLLRGPGRSRFVIDVNGWSLVKNSPEYAVQCAHLLAQHITSTLISRNQIMLPHYPLPLRHKQISLLQYAAQKQPTSSSPDLFDQNHTSPCAA